jgi:hypothetical protein
MGKQRRTEMCTWYMGMKCGDDAQGVEEHRPGERSWRISVRNMASGRDGVGPFVPFSGARMGGDVRDV